MLANVGFGSYQKCCFLSQSACSATKVGIAGFHNDSFYTIATRILKRIQYLQSKSIKLFILGPQIFWIPADY